MAKIRFLIALLLLAPCIASAGAADSLTRLPQPAADTDRVLYYCTLAKNLRNTEPQAAFLQARTGLRLADSIRYPAGKALAYDVLGVLSLNKGEYGKALYNHLSALRINKAIGNRRRMAGNCNNIGSVYYQLKKYDEARKYFNQSLELKQKLGMQKEMSSTLINIGNVLMKEGDDQGSIRYYRHALANAELNHDDYNVSVALMNLGEAWCNIRQYGQGIACYERALVLNRRNGDELHEGNCLYAMGKVHILTKDYSNAEKELNDAKILLEQAGAYTLQMGVYNSLSLLYEKRGDYGRSLEYYKAFHELSDSVYNAESARQVGEIHSKYELEKKDEQINLLNKDNKLRAASVNEEKIIRNFFIVAFLLSSIIVFALARNVLLKKRVNKILTAKNHEIGLHQQQIEAQNKLLSDYNKELMKENISARYEILKNTINPHFLFNSLSTLSTLIIKNQNAALNYVVRFSKIYRRILELGNKQLISIEDEAEFVSDYLQLQQIRFKDNLIFSFNIHKVHLNKLVPPFALQLLVENAIKHNVISNDHKLMIRIFSENDYIIVSNNIKRKEDVEKSTGIGQKNIADRYRLVSRIAPVFEEDEDRYIVSLPIIKDAHNI